MDWSYDLLSEQERRVLGELAVFAGSFGLVQVAEVCTAGDQRAALDLVDRLASKSLVAAEPGEDGTRYRLLETVRQYAADRLAETGDAEAARQRHALAFLSLAERDRRIPITSAPHCSGRWRRAIRPGRRSPARSATSGWGAGCWPKPETGSNARSHNGRPISACGQAC
jgi:hypothetical protein